MSTMRFIAVDVETPNRKNDRICAIGITEISGEGVLKDHYYLVDPECEFDRFNIDLTGIDESAVAGCPNFGELWKDISGMFENAVIIAHNASFDRGVLIKTLAHYGIEFAPEKTICTYWTAKNHLKDVENYKLDALAEYFDIALDHHNAASDAHACAELYLKLNEYGKIHYLKPVIPEKPMILEQPKAAKPVVPEAKEPEESEPAVPDANKKKSGGVKTHTVSGILGIVCGVFTLLLSLFCWPLLILAVIFIGLGVWHIKRGRQNADGNSMTMILWGGLLGLSAGQIVTMTIDEDAKCLAFKAVMGKSPEVKLPLEKIISAGREAVDVTPTNSTVYRASTRESIFGTKTTTVRQKKKYEYRYIIKYMSTREIKSITLKDPGGNLNYKKFQTTLLKHLKSRPAMPDSVTK